jgi:2-dehydropantoate 2-reductase
MGGLFAFRLKAAGFDVSLIARSGGTRQQELTLLTEAGEQAAVFAVEGPDAKGPIQLLWITTKSYSALEAATQLSHRFTPETVIVTLGNGMGYHERLSTLVLGKLIGGSTTAGCSSPSENIRKLAGEGQTRLGWWDGNRDAPRVACRTQRSPMVR